MGDFDIARLVHAELAARFHSRVPAQGRVLAVSTLTGVDDKGTAALLVQENCATDTVSGQPLVT